MTQRNLDQLGELKLKTTSKRSENNLNRLTEKLTLNVEIRITPCDSLKMNFLPT